jgi:Domain of unknown function (DUF4389)
VNDRPVHLIVSDDLQRSRLTVFFRLLLAIPHLIWLTLWALVAYLAAIVNWFATLITGVSPLALHRFLAAYVRYQNHVYAYLFLIADPYPASPGRPAAIPSMSTSRIRARKIAGRCSSVCFWRCRRSCSTVPMAACCGP